MKNSLLLSIFSILILTSCISNNDDKSLSYVHKLWYDKPASEWMESLPQGNGRLGITTYGGVESDTITLNEITMWSGQYDEKMHRSAGKKVLEQIHKAFFENDIEKVNNLATEHLAGNANSFGSHVPLGNMALDFKYPSDAATTDYKRELDLNTGVTSVTFKKDGVEYLREYICSNPDDVFVMKLSASEAKKISFDLSFKMYREHKFEDKEKGLEFFGTAKFLGPGGVEYYAKVALKIADGTVKTVNNKVQVGNASEVVIAFDARTNYSNKTYKEDVVTTVEKALNKKFADIKESHIKDHTALYYRAEVFFGDNTNGEDLPTDKRWNNVKAGGNDVVLDALFFNYARYLLIAASRENSPLPANLQGIWNDNLACNMGWANDYHLDINTQQNYWLANSGNLHELNKPLFSYIEHLAEHGQLTAKEVYDANGWAAHTIANVWGYTACGGGVNWGLFSLASSWISSHLWTQYEYTLDKDFLEQQAYPLLKSNVEFILDFLVEDPKTGYLIGGPSTSPENTFLHNGHHMSISMGTTADRVLAYELFTYCIEASKILEKDTDFRAKIETARSKLSPLAIGKHGGLQEWYRDFDEASPNHRHTTHLLAVYPFNQVTLERTPELAEAARKTIELRLAAEGWEDVEWSRANMISLYARLLDAEKAYESVVQLQREFTRENLLTISPEGIAGAPYDLFIFDGNEAGGAGIVEMLIQNHEGYIQFLPTLPKVWKDGFMRGISVKGGADVDLKWKDGKLQTAKMLCTATNTFVVRMDNNKPKATINGANTKLEIVDRFAHIKLNRGDVLEFIY